MVHQTLKASEILKTSSLSPAIVDIYRIKPLNVQKLLEILQPYERIVTLEEHLLSGGLGFLAFLIDFAKAPAVETILSPPREYTNLDDQKIEFINVISSEFIPQRTFFLGFPMGLLILGLLYSWYQKDFKNISLKKLSLLGFGVALISFVHTHSVVALAIISLVLFVMKPRPLRAWLAYGLSAMALGAIIFQVYLRAQAARGYFGFHLG
jgi:hypothetical protein